MPIEENDYKVARRETSVSFRRKALPQAAILSATPLTADGDVPRSTCTSTEVKVCWEETVENAPSVLRGGT